MNYEERDEYVQQKANEYCKKEKERGTLMKIKGVEPLVYKAYKNGYYESEKENKQLKQQITEAKENGVIWHDLRKNPNDLPNNNTNVIVKTNSITECAVFHRRLDGTYFWNCSFSPIERHTKSVIARCELPKLEVEE